MSSVGMVIISGVFAFVLSFAIGANDVANALGTSVGSKALTIKKAVVLAAVFEFLGVATMGQLVSDTLKSDIVSPSSFTAENGEYLFALGMTCTLGGSALWLLIATYFALPVSTTQTIVGGIIGFASMEIGLSQINMRKVLNIIVSWVVSPVLGALFGFAFYYSISQLIFKSKNPYNSLIKLFPFYASLTLSVLISFGLGTIFNSMGWSMRAQMLVSFGVFIGSLIILIYYIMPILIEKDKLKRVSDPISNEKQLIEDKFKYLMILSAVFVSYAHGGNDVANAVGPFSAVLDYGLSKTMSTNSTTVPFGVMVGGGIGIDIGLALLGYKVMETIGEKITKLSFSKGYCAQFSASLTVLVATVFGLPISTTSVLVGGVAGTGLVKEGTEGGIDKKVLLQIMAGWISTIFAGYFLTSTIYLIARSF